MEMDKWLKKIISMWLKMMRLSGAVVSTSDYESAGPSSISDEGRRRTAHPAVYPPKQVGG